MRVQKVRVNVTTDGAGAATVYSDAVQGELRQIIYTKVDFADGSTITVSSEETGEVLWTEAAVNASTTRAPRKATHTNAGVASLYAAGGLAVNDRFALPFGRIKIVIASGGAAKTGTFDLIIS